MNRFLKFSRLPRARQALLIEATFRLGLARGELMLFEFGRLAARLGGVSPPLAGPADSPDRSSPEQSAIARDVGWAVTTAARHLPFEAVCLPQVIAAKSMLARRKVESVLHFGLATGAVSDEPLVAHAWVDAAGVKVTGYPVAVRFKEVARASSTQPSRQKPGARRVGRQAGPLAAQLPRRKRSLKSTRKTTTATITDTVGVRWPVESVKLMSSTSDSTAADGVCLDGDRSVLRL